MFKHIFGYLFNEDGSAVVDLELLRVHLEFLATLHDASKGWLGIRKASFAADRDLVFDLEPLVVLLTSICKARSQDTFAADFHGLDGDHLRRLGHLLHSGLVVKSGIEQIANVYMQIEQRGEVLNDVFHAMLDDGAAYIAKVAAELKKVEGDAGDASLEIKYAQVAGCFDAAGNMNIDSTLLGVILGMDIPNQTLKIDKVASTLAIFAPS